MRYFLVIIAAVMLLPVLATAEIAVEPVLCTGIENRMPVGESNSFASDVDRVYLWAKVTGAAEPTTIRHVWLHEGEEIADVELAVKGDPWRTWSYKTMIPEWIGKWEVKIVGADGNVMQTVAFTVGGEATPVEEAETPAEEPAETEPETPDSSGNN